MLVCFLSKEWQRIKCAGQAEHNQPWARCVALGNVLKAEVAGERDPLASGPCIKWFDPGQWPGNFRSAREMLDFGN